MEYLVEYRLVNFQDCQIARLYTEEEVLAFAKKLKELNASFIRVNRVQFDYELTHKIEDL
jgi:hypothetical protein